MNKEKCPVCGKEATWSHQFKVHFRGAHLKKNNKTSQDEKDRVEEIKRIVSESSMGQERKDEIQLLINEYGPELTLEDVHII